MKRDHLTPLQIIRLDCLECAGSVKEVRNCCAKTCRKYIYRLGKNPFRRGIGGNPYLTITRQNGRIPAKNMPTQVGKMEIVEVIPDVIEINGIKFQKIDKKETTKGKQ